VDYGVLTERMTLPGAETSHLCFWNRTLPSLEKATDTLGAFVYAKGDLSSATEGKSAGNWRVEIVK